jgi:hypothetical protein
MSRGKYTDAEILELAQQPDITYVKGKDPDRFYIHAERDPLRVEDLRRQGYRVEGEEDGAQPVSPVALQSDGTSKVVNLPGHILMSRPKELHDKVMAVKRNRFEDMAKREQEEAMENVKKELDKIGVSSKLKKRVESVNRDF